jgi:hypothetical protein
MAILKNPQFYADLKTENDQMHLVSILFNWLGEFRHPSTQFGLTEPPKMLLSSKGEHFCRV